MSFTKWKGENMNNIIKNLLQVFCVVV